MRSSTSTNGSTRNSPNSHTRRTQACTTSSGVDAPAVSPMSPMSQAGSMSSADSMRNAFEPSAAATSTRRFALLLAGAPTTRTVAHLGAMTFTAFCRFWVA